MQRNLVLISQVLYRLGHGGLFGSHWSDSSSESDVGVDADYMKPFNHVIALNHQPTRAFLVKLVAPDDNMNPNNLFISAKMADEALTNCAKYLKEIGITWVTSETPPGR